MKFLKKLSAAFLASMFLLFAFSPMAFAAPGTRVYSVWTYKNVTSSTTTSIKAGAGILHGFCVNTVGTTSTLVLWDSLSASGSKIGSWTTTAVGCYYFDAQFNVGLTAVTGGTAGDLTFAYQ